MLAEDRFAASGEAERGLEFASEGENRSRGGRREGDGRGDVASGATDGNDGGGGVERDEYGIVDGPLNGSVVQEKGVGQVREALESLVIVVAEGLFGGVARRHDKGRQPGVEKQVVERRVGEHDAQGGVSGRDQATHGRVGAARGEHDGRGGGEEKRFGFGREAA